MEAHAYSKLPSDLVCAACDAYIADREKRQQAKKEEHIAYHMNKKWFPAKTRKAAIERCAEPFWGYSWELGGGLWVARVSDLKILAQSTDEVYVSMELFERIAPWYGKGE